MLMDTVPRHRARTNKIAKKVAVRATRAAIIVISGDVIV
jgi:hypothetical protein